MAADPIANKITHPDKVWFPKEKWTKGDVLNYYRAIASKMLPFLKGRPLVMQRFPDGIGKAGFFQKNVPDSFPSWIKTVSVKRKTQGPGKLVVCESKEALLYLVNFGCLTPHIWLSSGKSLEKPDRLVFDIDPPDGKIGEAREAARLLKGILEKRCKLHPFIMTTGSRGYHVVVPIKQTVDFDAARAFAKKVAAIAVEENPKLCTMAARKSARRGRVYIDVMRNAYAQHGVAPYAVRALPGAPIAMPISWAQLDKTDPQSFTLSRYPKGNAWSRFAQKSKRISKITVFENL